MVESKGMLLSNKKGQITEYTTMWINLKIIMLSEKKPDQKDKKGKKSVCHVIPFT